MSDLANHQTFVVRHRDCDLYIVERRGSFARWGTKDKALDMAKSDWTSALDANTLQYVTFEEA